MTVLLSCTVFLPMKARLPHPHTLHVPHFAIHCFLLTQASSSDCLNTPDAGDQQQEVQESWKPGRC